MDSLRPTLPLLCLLALAAPIPAAAREADCEGTEQQCAQDTLLISRSYGGDFPNGPSRRAEISHDGRNSRLSSLIVFESDASDLVRGDRNARTDVFIVHRRRPYDGSGSAWVPGATELASRGLGGRPANGRSYRPAVDGEFNTPAKCVGFISTASNLVRGDTNGVADAFVYYFRGNQVRRVSVDSRGRQANGPSYDIDFDGDCSRVAFTSSATNLALRRASSHKMARRIQREFVTRGRLPRGVKQVYMRHLGGDPGWDSYLDGKTVLLSQSDSGRPGNRDSSDPSFAYRFNSNHRKVAFESRATNLVRRDRNRRMDVFVRDLTDIGRHRTLLVSQTPRGRLGNGDSSNPSFGEQGFHVSFQTRASNLLSGDVNGVSDIARADLCRRKVGTTDRCASRDRRPAALDWISRDPGGRGNGASVNPAVSNGGSYTIFQTRATNFKAASGGLFLRDSNGSAWDVHLHTQERGIALLQSRDSTPSRSDSRFSLPAVNPAISAKGNYVLFETAEPYADVSFVRARHPSWLAAGDLLDADDEDDELADDDELLDENDYLYDDEEDEYLDDEDFDDLGPSARASIQDLGFVPSSLKSRIRATASRQPRYHQIYMRYLGSEKFLFAGR